MAIRSDLSRQYSYLALPSLIFFGYILSFVFRLPYIMIFVIFGIIPKLDLKLSKDWINPTIEQIKELEKKSGFRALLYLTLLLDWGVLVCASSTLSTVMWYDLIPLVFLSALLASMSFLIAHELIHKDNSTDKFFGTIHQIKNFYMHFTIEHLYGHHKKVATPEDPASAPKGMSLYRFLPKTVIGSLKSALQINPGFTLLSLIGSTLFFSSVYWKNGMLSLVFALIGGLGGVLVLEIINYVEHYGLQRKRNADGNYEKVTIRHSWNAPHRLTNYILYKLQRHSDHHENSMKPYQTLCSYEDSPQLPHGYIGCIIIAPFPSLWFDMMDPLVDQYKQSDKGVNLKSLKIAEQKAERILDQAFKITLILAVTEIIIKGGWYIGAF